MTELKPTPPSSNRSASWALGGVLVGFALPIVMCACLASFALVGLGAAAGGSGGMAASAPNAPMATHLSGPLVGPAVAVIDVNGPIVSGDSPDFNLTGGGAVAASGSIVRLVKQAARDPQVRAIVLRVDSPGGSVIGSDEIYNALKNAGKPVVVHMGSLAASGGYYVSMAADHIVAHPNTLTGSIGVISEFTNLEGLYEKLGLQSVIVKSGENKDFGAQTVPFTEEDRKLWQAVIDETYDSFVGIIADNRGMTVEEVKALADGRVYTGRQAYAAKLVDQLGYFEDAVDKAASLGGISGEPRVVEYRRQTPFAALFGASAARAVLAALGLPSADISAQGSPLQYR
jgi:protease-4